MKLSRIVFLASALFSQAILAAGPDVLFVNTGSEPREVRFISGGELRRIGTPQALRTARPYSETAILASARAAKSFFAEKGCSEAMIGDSFRRKESEPDKLITNAFSRNPVSFIARVVELKQGWVPYPSRYGRVATLVAAEVTEVLHDDSSHLKVGDAVSFLQDYGSFDFEGVTFCTRNPELTPAEVGDFIVLAGSRDDQNGPSVLDVGLALRVVGSRAVPTKAFERAQVPGIDIAQLRAIARTRQGAGN